MKGYDFKINIICPDGRFTKEEIEEMIRFWFERQRVEKGIAYRVLYEVEDLEDV